VKCGAHASALAAACDASCRVAALLKVGLESDEKCVRSPSLRATRVPRDSLAKPHDRCARPFHFGTMRFVLKCSVTYDAGGLTRKPVEIRVPLQTQRASFLQLVGMGTATNQERIPRMPSGGGVMNSWYGPSLQLLKAFGLLTLVGGVARGFVVFGAWRIAFRNRLLGGETREQT
jgi:hypothetical protein